MFTSLTAFVFMMAFVKLIQAGRTYDPYKCNPGQGFAKHRDQCDKYYQCTGDDNGLVKVEQQCAFGTFWNYDASTCMSIDDVDCPNDKCKTDNRRYKANGNCRGFYECVNGKSTPGCCDIGDEYDEAYGCISDSDESCTESCLGKPEPQAPIVCDKRPARDPAAFDQDTNGIWQPMQCAPGSEYVHINCSCQGFRPAPIQLPVCRREIFLPFNTDLRDHSGYNHAVLVTNVELSGTGTNGRAIFNGNSRLTIPRFSNLDHVNSLYIRIKYTPSSDREKRILVSNKCGNTDYSIMLDHVEKKKDFTVITDYNVLTLEIKQNQNNGEQDVIYQVDNGRFTAASGPELKGEDLPGYIKQINCPIYIGWAAGRGYNGFIGEINEVEIYLCNPNIPQ